MVARARQAGAGQPRARWHAIGRARARAGAARADGCLDRSVAGLRRAPRPLAARGRAGVGGRHHGAVRPLHRCELCLPGRRPRLGLGRAGATRVLGPAGTPARSDAVVRIGAGTGRRNGALRPERPTASSARTRPSLAACMPSMPSAVPPSRSASRASTRRRRATPCGRRSSRPPWRAGWSYERAWPLQSAHPGAHRAQGGSVSDARVAVALAGRAAGARPGPARARAAAAWAGRRRAVRARPGTGHGLALRSRRCRAAAMRPLRRLPLDGRAHAP